MKYILLPLFVSFFILNQSSSHAQSFDFSYFQEPYVELVDDTSINLGTAWNDPQFTWMKSWITALPSPAQAMLGFNGGTGAQIKSNSPGFGETIAPYFNNMIDRGYNLAIDTEGGPGSLSPISYKVYTDTIGTRSILKIQWKNVGFYDEYIDDSISSAYTNFQLWLSTGGVMEFRFGPSHIPSFSDCFREFPGPVVGIFHVFGSSAGLHYVATGDPLAPVYKELYYPTDTLNYLTDTIPEGMVYRFKSTYNAINDPRSTKPLNLFPNPTSDHLQFNIPDHQPIKSVEVWSMLGAKVASYGELESIDVSDLTSGSYLIRVRTEDNEFSSVFQKL